MSNLTAKQAEFIRRAAARRELATQEIDALGHWSGMDQEQRRLRRTKYLAIVETLDRDIDALRAELGLNDR